MITQKLKRSGKSITVKASVWYTLSNMAARGITVLMTPVFTRLLSPTEYGIYPLYVSWMGIFTVLETLEISGGVMYRTLSKFSMSKDESASNAVGIQSMLTVLFLTVYIIFRKRINAITSLSTLLTVLLILQIFLNSVQGIYFAVKRYSYEYKRVSFINTVSGIATPLLSIMFIYLGVGGMSRVISPLVVTSLFSIPIIIVLIKRGCSLFCPEKWKYFLGIALPMLPNYLSLSIIAGADKIIISHTLGEVAIGKYSVAYSIGFMMSLITNGISLAFSPWIMQSLKEEAREEMKNKINLITDACATLTLLFLAVAPEIFSIAVPREYYNAFPVIYPIAISVVFLFLSGLLSNAILHYEKPFKITLNSVLSAAVFLILAFILIKRYSYFGGAISTLAAYILLFLLNFRTFRKESGYSILNTKNCLQIFSKFFLLAILLYMTRNVPVSRFLLAIATLAIFAPKLKERGCFV